MIIREGAAGAAVTSSISASPERTAKQVELCMHVLSCALYRYLSLKYIVLNIICLKGKVSHFFLMLKYIHRQLFINHC